MTFVELFFHCDAHECEAHDYVPGERVKPDEEAHVLPKGMPEGWQRLHGKDYCKEHNQ